MNRELTASMEDYLEIIYILVKKNKVARAKDIAEHLEVKKPSVTGALRVLAEKGFIRYTPYGYIDLTEDGEKTAVKIFRRHEILNDFFTKILKVDSATSEDEACKIEHAISDSTLEKLVNFMHFFEHCPRVEGDWLESFNKFCSKGPNPSECKSCMEEALKKFGKGRKGKKSKEELKLVKNHE